MGASYWSIDFHHIQPSPARHQKGLVLPEGPLSLSEHQKSRAISGRRASLFQEASLLMDRLMDDQNDLGWLGEDSVPVMGGQAHGPITSPRALVFFSSGASSKVWGRISDVMETAEGVVTTGKMMRQYHFLKRGRERIPESPRLSWRTPWNFDLSMRRQPILAHRMIFQDGLWYR